MSAGKPVNAIAPGLSAFTRTACEPYATQLCVTVAMQAAATCMASGAVNRYSLRTNEAQAAWEVIDLSSAANLREGDWPRQRGMRP
jgi:hypothetical protein